MAPLTSNTYLECLFIYSVFSIFKAVFNLWQAICWDSWDWQLEPSARTEEEFNTCTDSCWSQSQHFLRGDRCGWLPPASIFHVIKLGTRRRGGTSKAYYSTVCERWEEIPSPFHRAWKRGYPVFLSKTSLRESFTRLLYNFISSLGICWRNGFAILPVPHWPEGDQSWIERGYQVGVKGGGAMWTHSVLCPG